MYIALIKSSYHVEGDERSRTNPGHGYPAQDIEYTEAIEFQTKEDFQRWFEANPNKTFRLFQCTPVTVKKTVSIEFNTTRGA